MFYKTLSIFEIILELSELLIKSLPFKGGVLIYAEHCVCFKTPVYLPGSSLRGPFLFLFFLV